MPLASWNAFGHEALGACGVGDTGVSATSSVLQHTPMVPNLKLRSTLTEKHDCIIVSIVRCGRKC